MAVPARDLPGARLRRYGWHAAAGLAALLACWAAAAAAGGAGRARDELDSIRNSLAEHVTAADGVAAECGLARFSGEADLERFPLELSSYPTRREMDCANRVSVARADLIEDHLKLREAGPRAERARGAARRWTVGAAVLLAVWLAGIYLAEVRPARAGARGRAPR